MGEVDLTRDGAVLETNRPYLIPLIEHLDLPPDIRGKANPKSSTGRIDVFTRLITDTGQRFDEIASGYRGPLYLEVSSSTFTIKVHPGLALNQLRLMHGRAQVTDEELALVHQRHPVLFVNGARVNDEDLHLSDGVFLGLDFTGDANGVVGYRAKRNSRLLDLSAIDGHDPADYWEPVSCERGDQLVLEPEEFYLLLSAEAVSIPREFAAEMAAYDPTSGELRTHYAGFFDPGFGYDDHGLAGSQAALEVRAHDVPFMVQHRQRVCRLTFEHLVEPADVLYGEGIGSNYQGQQSTLSKYFARPKPADQLEMFT
jgi:dCTP deaminase